MEGTNVVLDVTTDNAVGPGGLYEVVELVSAWHVCEVRPTKRIGQPLPGQYDNLAQLRPGYVGTGAECIIAVAGDNPVLRIAVVHGLDVRIEHVVGPHISEVRPTTRIYRPVESQHHYLGYLCACSVVA